MKRAAFVLALGVSACGPGGREQAPIEVSCRATLPPRATAPDPAPASPSFAAERSTIVTHLEVPLAGIRQALEAKIAKRVAEERDHDLGPAGRLEYTVDRGPFAVSVDGDALVVATPLDGHARAYAKGQSYSGCDPQLLATARVPLRLGPDFKFRPSHVRIDVVRGCEVRVLGGFLRIDVTPMLEARLAQESRRIEAQIDRELPDLRPQAERIWSELAKPRPLPLGACVVVAPEGITQGAPSGTPELARLRLGLLARPELRLRCTEAARASPLPPLRDDPALGPEGDVQLAIVLPPDALANAIGGSPEIVELGSARTRMPRANGTAAALAVTLAGEACGDTAVRAAGATWDPSGRAIRLTGVALAAGEAERFAPLRLDVAGVPRAIERIAIPVAVAGDELRSLLPEAARALSDDRVTASAVVRDAHPGAAGIRGAEPVAVVVLRGAVTLRAR